MEAEKIIMRESVRIYLSPTCSLVFNSDKTSMVRREFFTFSEIFCIKNLVNVYFLEISKTIWKW